MIITFTFRLPYDDTIYYGKIDKTIIDLFDIKDIYINELIKYDIIVALNSYMMYHNKPVYNSIKYKLYDDKEITKDNFDLYINDNKYIFKGHSDVIE